MRQFVHRFLACLLVAAVAVPGLAAGPDDTLIVPGVRVGAIELGQPLPPAVLRSLGKPTNHERATPGPDGRDSGVYFWAGKLIVKLNDGKGDNHVFSVFVAPGNARYKTEQGIGVGSSFAAVKRAYPTGTRTEAPDGEFGWALPGIEFSIGGQKVLGVGVFPKEVQ